MIVDRDLEVLSSILPNLHKRAYLQSWSPRKIAWMTARLKFVYTVETLDRVDPSLDPYEIVSDWKLQYYPWWSCNTKAHDNGLKLLAAIIPLAGEVRVERARLIKLGYDYDYMLTGNLANKAKEYKETLVSLWKSRDKSADPPNERDAKPPIDWRYKDE